MGCPTVKIISQEPEAQGPYIIINESDFDAEIMRLYEEPAAAEAAQAADNAKGAK